MKIKIKYLVFLCAIFTKILLNAQTFDLYNIEFKGNVKNVVEKSIKYSDSWREFDFDNLYRLKEKRYFSDYKLVQTENWDYFDEYFDGNHLLVEIERINKREVARNKYYFDSGKRLKRLEKFLPLYSTFPTIILTDLVYDNSKLLSYNRITISARDTTLICSYKIKYSKLQITIYEETDNENISSSKTILKYDKKGNLKTKIVDYQDPEVVLGGVRTWSKRRHNKYRIDYKYDKYGNWTEHYAVTWLRKYKEEVRIIEYD